MHRRCHRPDHGRRLTGKNVMYVIIVNFEIDPEQIDTFLPLMRENAAALAREEPGCRQLDVCHDADHPGHVFLYEVYDDRAAFDTHLSMPHFKSFDATTAGMIRSKKVRALTRL
jgi:autoinducer 2-degrading protein